MYEEAWALLLCAQWMISSGTYSDVRFQTAPDEAGDGKFFLDDIVFKRSDGSYDLYQIKHRIHPDTKQWKWNDFTKRNKNNSRSELAKWFDSIRRVKKGGADCQGIFLTNGEAHPDVAKYLVGEGIDYESLKGRERELAKNIQSLIEPEQCASFFDTFVFRFNQKSLEDVETEAWTVLCSELNATESGVHSLILELRKQFAVERPKAIRLETLKEWCEFDVPRPLNQEFEIPDDFQWFDGDVHKRLIDRLAGVSGGVQMIVGKPGSGKSTYLSKLTNELSSAEYVCIRHHYHISPSDPDPIDRLSIDRSEEALKAQFKKHEGLLGDLEHKNSAEVALKDFVSNAAANCHGRGKPLILIIDGLDHAMRNEAVEDLEDLLRQTCRPQPGLWVILGMQAVAEVHLPEIVLTSCPKSDWVEIEGLNDAGVDALVSANQIGLNLPDDSLQLAPILAKIRNMTHGNPLHLRYTLRQLKLQQGATQVSEYGLQDLVPYDNEIGVYYATLWRNVPEAAKSLILAIQILDVPLSEEQFFDLTGSLVSTPVEVTTAHMKIAHLVSRERDGYHLFHASLRQFLITSKEYHAQRVALLRRVETWLSASSFDELKWALLGVIRHQLGTPNCFLSIDRDWLVESVAKGRPAKAIERQLTVAHDAAFDDQDYARVARLASLLNYFLGNSDYHSDVAERIWISAFRYYQGNPSTIKIATLSYQQILAVLETARSENQLDDLLDDCLEELNRSHRYYEFHRKGKWTSAPPELAQATIAAVSMDPLHDVDRVIEYCRRFEDLGWSAELTGYYAKALCCHGIDDKVILSAIEKLQGQELKGFCDILSLRCIWSGHRNLVSAIERLPDEQTTPDACLYLALSGRSTPNSLTLPEYDVFPDEVDEFDSKGKPSRVRSIRSAFVSALSFAINGQSKEVEDWVSKAPKRWSTQMVAALMRAAMDIAQDIETREQISLSRVVNCLGVVAPLNWPDDRPRIEWQMSLPDAIGAILEVVVGLARWYGQRPVVALELLQDGLPIPYFGNYGLLRFMNNLEITLLTDEDYRSFIESELHRYQQVKSEFPERARHYLDLFDLCMLYADGDNASQCLYQAANNLLGYGSHKDPFLWYTLESIEACIHAGSHRALGWLKRVAPVITNIRQITDEDDVQGFPGELGNLLSICHPPTLCSWYRFAVENEHLSLAEELFPKLLESLDLRTPSGKAIALTGIDRGSLTVLRRLALENSHANAALLDIEDHLGRVSPDGRQESTSSVFKKPTQREVAHIEPADVKRHLSESLQSWERSYFYKPWAQTWLAPSNPRRREAYNALTELVDPNSMCEAPAELLDELYPLVFEEDRERAFDYLCWAQANDRGWAYMYTDKSRAETRWNTIAEHFRHRFREFFEESVRRTDARKGHDSCFFPVPRGVEYHSRFNDLSTAEAVTEALVQSLESLTANLELPSDSWLDSVEPDNTEILFLRLGWPSSYVRERAATAIAALIQEEFTRSRRRLQSLSWIALRCRSIKPKLIGGNTLSDWFAESAMSNCGNLQRLWHNLRDEQMESEVVLQLLLVVKCLEEPREDLRDVFLLLCHQVQLSSPVIGEILSEIGRSLHAEPPSPEYREARTPPESYAVDRFFRRYITLFLVPYYVHEAEGIESRTSFRFTDMWSYEADRLMDESGIAREAGEAPDFVGGRLDPVVSSFSSKISEVYRSAFLRTLNHCFSVGMIDKDPYLDAAFKTMPVELSSWKLRPSRMPDWWPTAITKVADDGKSDSIIGVEFDREIDRVCEGIGNDLILGMTGPAKCTDEKESHKHSLRITIVGFAYHTLGSDIPSADSLAKQLLYKPGKFMRSSTAKRPFHFMESQGDHVQVPEGRLEIGDLVCEPLVARANDLTINLWQSYRDVLTFLLADSLSNNLRLSLDQNRWVYSEDPDQIVASGYDWTNGIGERRNLGDNQQFGTYLTCDKRFLEDYLSRTGMRLGYLCAINHSYRKYDYEEPEEYSENRLINVSRIIT